MVIPRWNRDEDSWSATVLGFGLLKLAGDKGGGLGLFGWC